MEAWQRWYQMAQGSLAAAVLLKTQGEARSSASRAYYAAYQAITAVLLYQGKTPPEGREAWSYEATQNCSGSCPGQFLRKMPAEMLLHGLKRLTRCVFVLITSA